MARKFIGTISHIQTDRTEIKQHEGREVYVYTYGLMLPAVIGNLRTSKVMHCKHNCGRLEIKTQNSTYTLENVTEVFE